MSKNGMIIRVFITLLFFVSLYFVEAGFCGSSVVAKYNDGFGTFDMKHYDVKTVQNVLSSMNQKGVAVYKRYYFMDFIFVLCFGAFQLMLTNDLFSFERSKLITLIIFGVPIFRGICDIIENAILLWTLHTYPRINELAISISAKFTAAKLMSIRIWALLIVIGLVWKVVLLLKR
ncbi:MAG: hypothetical protein PUD20_09310 [bacterium]|nr:hypothetical protein [bacterium]